MQTETPTPAVATGQSLAEGTPTPMATDGKQPPAESGVANPTDELLSKMKDETHRKALASLKPEELAGFLEKAAQRIAVLEQDNKGLADYKVHREAEHEKVRTGLMESIGNLHVGMIKELEKTLGTEKDPAETDVGSKGVEAAEKLRLYNKSFIESAPSTDIMQQHLQALEGVMVHGAQGWQEAQRINGEHNALQRKVAEINAGQHFQGLLGQAMATPAVSSGTSGGPYMPESLQKPARFHPYKPAEERSSSGAAASTSEPASAGVHDVFGGWKGNRR